MAKRQATEEDLQAGLKAAGGFGGLTKPKTKRDSPFAIGVVNEEPINQTGEFEAKGDVEKAGAVNEYSVSKKEAPEQEEKIKKISPVLPAQDVKAGQKSVKDKVQEKAPIQYEKANFMLTPEMRDMAQRLALEYQRKKADKRERITVNTIYRAALRTFLTNMEYLEAISPNTEDELVDLVSKK